MRHVVLAILVATSSAHADALPPPPVWQPTPSPELGVTVEGGIGLSRLAALGSVGGDITSALGGPALGFGGFLARRFALGVRLTGATIVDQGTAYVGVLAPNGQLWVTDRTWFGGGVGLGLIAVCSGGCDALQGVGFNARLGYAFAPLGHSAANLSVELAGVVPHAPIAVVSISALLGVQAF